MFDKIIDWVRQVKNRMFGAKTVGDMVKKDVAMSQNMTNKIELWAAMYAGKSPWLAKNRKNPRLPCAIASELARLVVVEVDFAVNDPSGSDSENTRAAFLNKTMEPVMEKLGVYVEYACALGGLVFKPSFDGQDIVVDYIQADNFFPTEFNSRGEVVSGIFIERKDMGKTTYRRVETHTKTDNGYIITNEAYCSQVENDIGRPVELSAVREWAELEPSTEVAGLDTPLFSYLKMPFGNTEERSSPLGVSVYDRAIDMIEDADRQYQSTLWEYEGGELAVDVSEDLYGKRSDGTPMVPEGRERLFRTNKLDPSDSQGDNKLMSTFSPTLRDESYLRGLNKILALIEFTVGLAYGTISDPQYVEKTATEVRTSKQRSYVTVKNIQGATEDALNGLVSAIDALATLYNLAPQGDYETAYVWDDSIVVDAEAERVRDMNEVTHNLLKKWEYRMKWHGLDEETAKKLTADDDNGDEDGDLLGGEGV